MRINNKIFSKLYTNSLILSLPGFLSIFLSLFAIPIHLKIAGTSNYGNYLLFHILLSLSFLLNFGISKSIVIASKDNKKYIKNICFNGIKYSCYLIFIIVIFYLFFKLKNFTYLEDYIISKDLFFLGLCISIIYLTFEGIIQANKLFLRLSVFNFIFYSLSLSLPSIMLIINNNMSLNDLISLSIMIKLTVTIIILLFLIKTKLLEISNDKIFFKIFKKNSPWLTMNSAFVQLYEMLDKYLIKLFIGSNFLAIYSIPQQLTGKLSILSKGFSAFLLPNINKKNKNLEFYYSLEIFLKYIPILVFLLFPFFPVVLKFWLGNEYSMLINNLTKIFSLIAILSCASHILVTKYEADQVSNINFKIEIIFLPFFLISLLFLTYNSYSLIVIALLILVKELVLIIFRLNLIKIKAQKMKSYYTNLCFFIFLLIISFIDMNFFYLILATLIFITFKNVKLNN